MDWDVARAIGVVVAVAACVWLYLPRSRVIRGRRLLTEKQARRMERDAKKDCDRRVRWGGHLLPREAETAHFLCVGTTGSGKTLTIKNLMRSVLPDVGRVPDQRALVYDAKQDVLSFLGSLNLQVPVVTLNPFDARGAAWAMGRDVTTVATALQVAEGLVPQERGANRFFSDAARDVVTATQLAFMQLAPGNWGLSDLLLAIDGRGELEAILSTTDRGRKTFALYFSEERTAANILATIRSRLAPLEPIAALWQRSSHSLSLAEWSRGQSVLVLGNDESVRVALDALNRVIFRRAVELVLARSESRDRRSWFFLDEVREAGKLDGLTSLLTKGRSKGACAVLGFQDAEGLRDAYGVHRANEIMGQCSNKAVLRLESFETAQWASRLMGDDERIEIRSSVNTDGTWQKRQRTRSEQRVKAEVVMPGEFLSLPPTNFRNGLVGYYLTPFLGAYRSVTPLGDLLGPELTPGDSSGVPNFISRPGGDQHIKPWGADDEKRLGLAQCLGTSGDQVAPTPFG